MKKLLTILLAMWLVEMSVNAGVAASKRPRRRATVDVTPTPAPSRSVPSKCPGGSCPLPSQSQPRMTVPVR